MAVFSLVGVGRQDSGAELRLGQIVQSVIVRVVAVGIGTKVELGVVQKAVPVGVVALGVALEGDLRPVAQAVVVGVPVQGVRSQAGPAAVDAWQKVFAWYEKYLK